MKYFAVIKANVVDGIAIANEPIDVDGLWVEVTDVDPRPGPGWSYDNGVFAPPPTLPPPPPIIPNSAFLDRFTQPEYLGILTAAKTDVEVEAWNNWVLINKAIDLAAQRTKDGIAMLVGKGLFTQQRANEILTSPIQLYERP